MHITIMEKIDMLALICDDAYENSRIDLQTYLNACDELDRLTRIIWADEIAASIS